ncbi:pyridoxal phosphate-dependent aminotransferase [Novosphingobium resinovorum]|uniref:Aminotransferase n=1 Tax=Novosphingobium resinovorum TaxID=158500 RepID=A0A031JSG6_9SPHN|nr:MULTISPECIES: pyridoxal phosphate-dependent aminotransferase [Novosphingobium]EZP80736.1 HisC-like protein [Novosphingobium resinovorum]MBF7012736.1 pyridoxal phosphate-dependent aminotransferase [Novosphingobium sp. HR1a]WJM27468.1 pyridoxal phosphate-dependent aminotransferase [Novosphingobium resinovorum]
MPDTLPLSLDDDLKHDLVTRGYDRRSFGRIAVLLGGGVAAAQVMPGFGPAFAQVPKAATGTVRIGANECWTGPFPAGVQAAMKAVTQGNRYEPDGEIQKLRDTVAMVERVPADRVVAWPGSSDPLARIAVTFASPTRGIVTADPTFEPIWQVGEWLGAKVSKVPLTPTNAHDVRAMLSADPNGGLYYICTPNNPTGTLTPLADIEWLLAAKPKDAVVLVDEAYLHFAGAPSAMPLAATRSDVIVMRSFSKLFGMAGMRLGLTVADPALHKRMMRYDGDLVTMMLPITAVACGTASLTQTGEIAARRSQMEAAREETLANVAKRGLKVLPGSRANMFLLEWNDRSPKQMSEAFLAQGVQIGRSWSAYPRMSRITVGSAEDMAKFRLALDRILTG